VLKLCDAACRHATRLTDAVKENQKSRIKERKRREANQENRWQQTLSSFAGLPASSAQLHLAFGGRVKEIGEEVSTVDG
jgi:hypothetical protein